jgi:pimeloyl-ACP methyl ester carboxylesterase
MVRLWRLASPDRIDERIATLSVPVFVVRGTRDALCPHDWAAGLLRWLRPGAWSRSPARHT